jgi:AbrB family looped-hinge helix DNA binding protein
MYPVSITSQGQISIPAPIRRLLGLNEGSKAIVSTDNGKIVIEPVVDFLDLAGTFKTNEKPLTNDQLHEVVARAMVKEGVK